MKDDIKISIVAVCYNHSKFAVETLESIVNQTYKSIQFIIIDDCSTDNSVEVINNWIKENNIPCVFIKNNPNLGLCKTLNKALTQVEGELVQLIACDDVLALDKIEKNVEVFNNHPGIALVHSNAHNIDENGNPLFTHYYDFEKIGFSGPCNYLSQLLKDNLVNAPTILYKTEAIRKVGGFDESLFYEDWDMLIRLSEHYDFCAMNESLVKKRILATSISNDDNNKIKMYNSSLSILFTLLKKHRKYSITIIKTIIKQIDRLIDLNAATRKQLYFKMYHGKSLYAFYLITLSLIGFNQKKSIELKKKLIGR
jgi:glycosyltransferase involved in cell wall biosynthesis